MCKKSPARTVAKTAAQRGHHVHVACPAVHQSPVLGPPAESTLERGRRAAAWSNMHACIQHNIAYPSLPARIQTESLVRVKPSRYNKRAKLCIWGTLPRSEGEETNDRLGSKHSPRDMLMFHAVPYSYTPLPHSHGQRNDMSMSLLKCIFAREGYAHGIVPCIPCIPPLGTTTIPTPPPPSPLSQAPAPLTRIRDDDLKLQMCLWFCFQMPQPNSTAPHPSKTR